MSLDGRSYGIDPIYVIFHDDDEHEDVSSISLLLELLSGFGRGAHIRTVASSEADANIDG